MGAAIDEREWWGVPVSKLKALVTFVRMAALVLTEASPAQPSPHTDAYRYCGSWVLTGVLLGTHRGTMGTHRGTPGYSHQSVPLLRFVLACAIADRCLAARLGRVSARPPGLPGYVHVFRLGPLLAHSLFVLMGGGWGGHCGRLRRRKRASCRPCCGTSKRRYRRHCTALRRREHRCAVPLSSMGAGVGVLCAHVCVCAYVCVRARARVVWA
jgi:hypothetical protein